MLAARDDAQGETHARGRLPDCLVNLLRTADAPLVYAPHRIAHAERRPRAKRAVGLQLAHDDAAPERQLAHPPQRARRARRDEQGGEHDRRAPREQPLREIEHEEGADVNELRQALAGLDGEEGGEHSPGDEEPEGKVERGALESGLAGRQSAQKPPRHRRGETHPGPGNRVRRGQRVDGEANEREPLRRAPEPALVPFIFVESCVQVVSPPAPSAGLIFSSRSAARNPRRGA